MPRTTKDPKQLSAWPAFDVPAKIAAWLDQHKHTDRLEPDDQRGGYVHLHRASKRGAGWAEVGHYDSHTDFAVAQGIVSSREVAAP